MTAAYALLIVSCESPFAPDDVAVSQLETNPLSVTISVGETRAITVRVVDDAGATLANRRLFWSTQNPAIASVSQEGIVSGVGAGTTQVAVSSGGKSAIVPVTVNARPVSLVRVTPSTSVVIAGTTRQLTAQALDAGGETVVGRPVLWTTVDASIATVTSTGLVSALSAGTTNITATIDGVVGSAVFTVQPVPVASVTLSPDSVNLIVGRQLQLTATPRDAAGAALAGRAIAWSSSAPATASVSSTGVVTALSAGAATITASSEGKGATARIVVSLIPIDTLSVTPRTATVAAGQTVQLSARSVDATGALLTGRSIAWDTDQPTIATVSATGLVSALTAGRASITASAEGKSATSSITVSPVPVALVSILPAAATILLGKTQQFTATTRDAANNLLPGRSITWISGAPSVATVTQSGLVTAVGAGSALIFAASEGVSTSVTVTVTTVGVASVRVSPSTGNVAQGQTLQLAVTPLDASGNPIAGRAVAWNSSAPTLASVSSTGLVSGISAGSATITATIDGVTGSASITVTPTPVATVTLIPGATTMTVGNSLSLTLLIADAAGTPLSPVGRTISWLSSSPSTASVNSNGQVLAVAPGSATIQATVDGVSGASSITVTNVPVISVSVAPASASLNLGATQQLTATPRDGGGNVLTGRSTTWSTSSPAVASVSTTGLVTAVGVGASTITATVDGVQGTSSITVTAVPVATVTVSPSTSSVTEGQTTTLVATARDGAGNVLAGRTIVWSSSNNTLAAVSQSGVVTAIAPTPSGTPVTITATATGAGVGGASPAGASAVTVDYAAVTSITLNPSAITVPKNTTSPVTATLFAGSATLSASGRTVSWTTADPSVATVSPTGTITGVAPGATTLTVRASSPGQVTPATQTAAITVTALPVASVEIDPFVGTLHVGTLYRRVVTAKTKDLSGTVLTGQTIIWSTPDAPLVSIDSVITTSGTTTIVGTSSAAGGLRLIASASTGTGTVSDTLVFASDLVPVSSVAVTPTSATLVGSPQSTQATLAATAFDSAGTKIDVTAGNPLAGRTPTWASSNGAVATVGSATGQVSGVAPGTADITASIGGTPSVVPSIITVIAAVGNVTVAISPDSVIAGNPSLQTAGGTVTVVDAGNNPLAGRAVTLSSASVATATVAPTSGTTSASGQLAFTVTGVAGGGTTSITANATGSGVTSTPFTVRVLRPVSSVSIAATPAGADSVIGTGALPLTATVRDAAGTVAGRVCTVVSASPAVASVSVANGVTNGSGQVAFTTTGVAPSGTPAAINVTCEGITGSLPLRVLAPVASVAVTSPSAADSVIGTATLQLQATTRDALGATLTGRPVTWAVSAATPVGAATVSQSGVVTGVLPGTASVTATSETIPSTPFAARILPSVATVQLTAGDSSIFVGETQALSVTLRDINNLPLTGRVVSYASSTPNVVSIDAAGVITAMGAGTTNITATSENKTSPALPFTVSLVPVSSVSVSATPTPNVYPTHTFPAAVVARDANGNVLSLAQRTITWTSSAQNVATVAAAIGSAPGTAVVTAVAPGTTSISATVDGVPAGTPVSLVVLPVPVTAISVTPSPGAIFTGDTAVVFTATPQDSAGNALSGKTLVWTSTLNTGKATIVDATTGRIAAVDSGTATITVTASGAGFGGSSPTQNVTLGVSLRPIGTVTLTPSTVTLPSTTGSATLIVDVVSAAPTQRPLSARACEAVSANAGQLQVTPGNSLTDAVGKVSLTISGVAPAANVTVTVTCDPGTGGAKSGTASVTVP